MTVDVEERAAGRWRAIVDASPELADAVRLQQAILAPLLEAEAAVRQAAGPIRFDAGAIASALASGSPAFHVIEGVVPAALLAPTFSRICQALAPATGGEAAWHIHEAVSSGRIDFASLLWSVLVRREDAVRAMAAQLDLAADLLWLIAELTVSPYANWVQEQLSAAPVSARRGWCPACGSWPALATEDRRGTRTAYCSFCAGAWTLAPRCPYCDDADAWQVLTPVDAAPHRRIAWCRSCRGYLKVIDDPGEMPFPLTSVEDLATTDLDRLAFEVGWTRPALHKTQPSGDCQSSL
jgi:hypothetical protein